VRGAPWEHAGAFRGEGAKGRPAGDGAEVEGVQHEGLLPRVSGCPARSGQWKEGGFGTGAAREILSPVNVIAFFYIAPFSPKKVISETKGVENSGSDPEAVVMDFWGGGTGPGKKQMSDLL